MAVATAVYSQIPLLLTKNQPIVFTYINHLLRPSPQTWWSSELVQKEHDSPHANPHKTHNLLSHAGKSCLPLLKLLHSPHKAGATTLISIPLTHQVPALGVASQHILLTNPCCCCCVFSACTAYSCVWNIHLLSFPTLSVRPSWNLHVTVSWMDEAVKKRETQGKTQQLFTNSHWCEKNICVCERFLSSSFAWEWKQKRSSVFWFSSWFWRFFSTFTPEQILEVPSWFRAAVLVPHATDGSENART